MDATRPSAGPRTPPAPSHVLFRLFVEGDALKRRWFHGLHSSAAMPSSPFEAVLAIALAGAIVRTPDRFDAGLMQPGKLAAAYPARALASECAHTTWVTRIPDGDGLNFDGHPVSDTASGARRYMRLMAHPTPCWPKARRAGCG